jgi:PKD repeat protein
MLAVAFIFLILMAFRFKNDTPCERVQFGFTTSNNNNVAYDNERIYFSSQIKFNASSWEWDFGDKTGDKTSGPDVTHEYKTPGEYTVKLTINGKCSEVRNISITKREKRNNKLYLRPVWPPDQLQAGKEYYFGDSTLGAGNWTWYFENGEVKRTKQNIVYQFLEPGEQKVTLVVNGEAGNGQVEKTFIVTAPASIKSPIVRTTVPDVGRPRSVNNDPIPEIPNYTEGNTSTGKSIPELYQDANKPPSLADGFLNSYILDINGNGGNALKKYLKNGSLANCIIIFNSHPISPEELKDNIRAHNQHPKSLSAKSETDAKENYIKVITITAEMEPRDRLLGKDKPRKYPH